MRTHTNKQETCYLKLLYLKAFGLYSVSPSISINSCWDSLRNQDTQLTGHSTPAFSMIVVHGIRLMYWVKLYEQSEMPVVYWGEDLCSSQLVRAEEKLLQDHSLLAVMIYVFIKIVCRTSA